MGKVIIPIVFLLACFTMTISGSEKTIVSDSPVKVMADSTVKVPDTDEIQRIANAYDKRIAELEARVIQLERRLSKLESEQ